MAEILASAGPLPEPCPSESFAIDLSGVSKRYGATPILDRLDLRLDGGAFTVVLGPSGCGKSTLLRLIAGLEDLSGGSIAIGGRVIDRLPPKDRGCAMVFQNYALYPHMSVAENIGYGLKLARMPARQRQERVRDVAAMLGLSELLSRKPGELSGGQRQRVAIGRAIARRPRVLLFDEPLSNLDAKLRQEMRIELRRLHDEIGATSVFVTHDQTEAMTLADRVIVMNRGRVEQEAAPAEIYRRPASLFVAGFVGSPAMNLLPARARMGQVQLAEDGRVTGFPVEAAEGDALVMGIRPEDVAIVVRGTPAAPGVPHLGGHVVAVEDFGSHVIVHCQVGCQVGSQRVLVQTRRAEGLEQGAVVTLALDPAGILVFDATSGRRLPSVPRETLQ